MDDVSELVVVVVVASVNDDGPSAANVAANAAARAEQMPT